MSEELSLTGISETSAGSEAGAGAVGTSDTSAPAEAVQQNDAEGFGLSSAGSGELGGEPKPEAKSEAEGEAADAKQDAKQEDYTLEAPEDFPIPESNLSSFTKACKDAGISKEQAEAVLAWHKAQYKEDEAWRVQQDENIRKSWAMELGKDSDFGGANLKNTQAEAFRALPIVDPEGKLRDLLRGTPWEYHPEIIKAVARVGRLMGEHEFVGGNGEGGAPRKSLWERMYGAEGVGLKN